MWTGTRPIRTRDLACRCGYATSSTPSPIGWTGPRVPVRVLSSCAGQGHDVLGALEARGPQDRSRVTGSLVELDPTNAAIARRRIADLGLALTVFEADAGNTGAYAGLCPRI